jgi:alcohol dehydrogenase class IV
MSTTTDTPTMSQQADSERNAVKGGFGLVRQPGTVVFGAGRRDTIPSTVATLGANLLICTDARMVQTAEFLSVVDGLQGRGIAVRVYSDVEPDLPRTNVEDLLHQVADAEIDVVLGIGGGSCLDMAKIATVMLTHGGDVQSYYGEFNVPGPTIPLVTVPTTAGTGAEATCISVIYEPDLGMKMGVASPYLEASATVVDPEFTLTCPPGLTAATGADALSHLIEAFTAMAKNPGAGALEGILYVGKNTMADFHCREGIRLMSTALERIVAHPDDLKARSDAMLAALHAGYAINTTGTAGIHALQSPIGALTHTPHGFGVGALLPYVMRFNLPARVPEFADMAELLGVFDPALNEMDNAHRAIERVEQILAALGVPANLAELGVDQADIPTIAASAMKATRLTANNPRELTEDAMVMILERAHAGDRTWWP